MPQNSESVEYLVKERMDYNNLPSPDRQSPTSSCFGMFNCMSKAKSKQEQCGYKRASRRIGVERQMRLTYQQPHLVEPMKLTVYEDLPSTPATAQHPSQISRIATQTRRSISRASTRASISVRRRTNLKPSISKPRPTVPASSCQLRRNPSFRPLQLSIYLEDKPNSGLPEFDSLSFTDEGDIRPPPRALIRTQSEGLLRPRSPTAMKRPTAPHKPASMFEQTLSRRTSHIRQNTDSTTISMSRPPSEYDALHSHPVSWYSMPSIPPVMQFATAPNTSKAILSPMREEFTPPPSGAVIINGTVLAFPDIEADRVPTEMAHRSLLPPAHGQENDLSAPSPIIDPGPNRRAMVITQHKSKISEAASIVLASSANLTASRTRATTLEQPQVQSELSATDLADPTRSYFHTDFQTNTRINQWLHNKNETRASTTTGRSRDSSVSTIKTTTTTSSFAEHRRKRSHFYQLNQNQNQNQAKPAPAVVMTVPAVTSPTPAPATSGGGNGSGSAKSFKAPTSLSLYRTFPPHGVVKGSNPVQMQVQAKSEHTRSKSSVSMNSHSHMRSMTTSTVASTIVSDVLFERAETPELEDEERDKFHSARALPHQLNCKSASHNHRRDCDAESMTTVDMKSRTGTMKSTFTSHSAFDDYRLNATTTFADDASSEIIAIEKEGFVSRELTSTPAMSSPRTPLSAKAADVEKMMFRMCAEGGYRRVNVGVAF